MLLKPPLQILRTNPIRIPPVRRHNRRALLRPINLLHNERESLDIANTVAEAELEVSAKTSAWCEARLDRATGVPIFPGFRMGYSRYNARGAHHETLQSSVAFVFGSWRVNWSVARVMLE